MNNCSEFSYFDTSEFYSRSVHSVGLFALPIHLFGAYCILFKTPPAMSSVKWILLNFHFWSCFLDFTLGLLITPYLLMPVFAGYPLGILNIFGIGAVEQFILLFLVVGVLVVSMILVFETRLLVIFLQNHWWRRARVPWFIMNYTIALSHFLVLYWMIPDQSITKDVLLARIQCIPPYIQLEKVFLLSNTTQLTSAIITIVLSFFGGQMSFFAALTWILLKKKKRETMSDYTIKLQKQFLKALVLQMALPAIILTLPAYHLLISVLSSFHHQYLNNISSIVISTHGMSTTVVMLFIHAPYRQFILKSLVFRVNDSKTIVNKLET